MFGLTILDIVVILVYFLVTIGIGVWSMRRIQSKEDYLLGGRRFGKLIQTFASFGQATSTTEPVGVVTTTFKNGAAGIWSSLLMLFSTPIYWITSPWQRRLRVLTMADFYEERFGSRTMASVYALVGTVGMMAVLSVGFSAMTKTIVAMTPKVVEDFTPQEMAEYELANELSALEGRDFALLSESEKGRLAELRQMRPRALFSYINENMLIWMVCFIVLIYAIAGGLEAAFYTDMLQGNFIIILSVLVLPFAWIKIAAEYGGDGMFSAFSILHERLPQAFFEVFGSPTLIDFTWYYILAISAVAGITVVTQPNQLVTNGAAKDEYSARFGFVTGTFTKRVLTLLWGMLGLASILLYGSTIQNSDLVWGHATRDLLGELNMGLVGLIIACMMAALMSTADCLMLTCSGLLMNNFYRPFVPDKSENHYVNAGRVSGAIFLIGAVIITTQFDDILQILKLIWEFFVIFAAAFWLGLKWRRANRVGAWASILSTLAIFYLLPLVLPVIFSGLYSAPSLLKETEPAPLVREYVAHEMDVRARDEEIARWDKMAESGANVTPRPEALAVGATFEKTFVLPSKSIFWSKGVKKENDQVVGSGYLYLEMILLDKLGMNLAQNPYALNETIRILIRLIFPFLVLIFVSLLTRPDEIEGLERFWVKMRTRTLGDREADDAQLEKAYANPESTREMLLFPDSNLEIYRWNKVDFYGFALSVGVMLVILGMFFGIVKLGG
ncbi:MAG: sodium:solute symporter family protein [Calditrichaeota bacterium]|nr:sodium:solute symporter family protein [Calditrichota bacterium]HQU71100.1 sodium:solute symporter family protein [Calditrichia bacterium]